MYKWFIKDGGKGSGNFGHKGRKGKVGGSGKGDADNEQSIFNAKKSAKKLPDFSSDIDEYFRTENIKDPYFKTNSLEALRSLMKDKYGFDKDVRAVNNKFGKNLMQLHGELLDLLENDDADLQKELKNKKLTELDYNRLSLLYGIKDFLEEKKYGKKLGKISENKNPNKFLEKHFTELKPNTDSNKKNIICSNETFSVRHDDTVNLTDKEKKQFINKLTKAFDALKSFYNNNDDIDNLKKSEIVITKDLDLAAGRYYGKDGRIELIKDVGLGITIHELTHKIEIENEKFGYQSSTGLAELCSVGMQVYFDLQDYKESDYKKWYGNDYAKYTMLCSNIKKDFGNEVLKHVIIDRQTQTFEERLNNAFNKFNINKTGIDYIIKTISKYDKEYFKDTRNEMDDRHRIEALEHYRQSLITRETCSRLKRERSKRKDEEIANRKKQQK